jgi:hypothetical protein
MPCIVLWLQDVRLLNHRSAAVHATQLSFELAPDVYAWSEVGAPDFSESDLGLVSVVPRGANSTLLIIVHSPTLAGETTTPTCTMGQCKLSNL